MKNSPILDWYTIFKAIFFQKMNFSQSLCHIWNQLCPKSQNIMIFFKFEKCQNFKLFSLLHAYLIAIGTIFGLYKYYTPFWSADVLPYLGKVWILTFCVWFLIQTPGPKYTFHPVGRHMRVTCVSSAKIQNAIVTFFPKNPFHLTNFASISGLIFR